MSVRRLLGWVGGAGGEVVLEGGVCVCVGGGGIMSVIVGKYLEFCVTAKRAINEALIRDKLTVSELYKIQVSFFIKQ